MIESKVINPKKFPDDGGEINYKKCFDYLEKLNENFKYKFGRIIKIN